METNTIILEENGNGSARLEETKLPILVLRGKVLFPNTIAGLDVGRERSIEAVEYALKNALPVFIVTQKNVVDEKPTPEAIFNVGVVAIVRQVAKISNKLNKVNVQCVYRAEIKDFEVGEKFDFVNIERADFLTTEDTELEAAMNLARQAFDDFTTVERKVAPEVADAVQNISDPNEFLNNAASLVQLKFEDAEKLLEERETIKRLELFYSKLQHNIEVSKIERRISSNVKKNIDKNQKEFILREQMKAIHTELGDGDNEKETLLAKVKAKKMPEEVEAKAVKELNRLDKLSPAMPDYTIVLNYVDQLLSLPFTEKTVDTPDINVAANILNEDHFGLEKVKERIIEYLSVLKLTGKVGGSILCFVGPPGVGKTSIAKSIARALNRKFVRMSLGGVRDEAEIRGHRRTYVGAMPGRIMYAMQNAGTVNPVFLLDEIDKMGSDINGDPASALLEVLDPEQNNSFRDRFMEIPYDLSEVMFITTANSLETIPLPLLDRMEIIELSSYTEEEKVEIAKRYLIPRQLKENGIDREKLQFTEDGIKEIIEKYTLEAGVRNLEREISSVARKVAAKVASGTFTAQIIADKNVVCGFLGVEKLGADDYKREDSVGITTGLAWTPYGGTTLNIEVALMKGKGEIQLTGKLGDVMKESAKTALSFIKSNADKYGIDADRFEKTDIHIHVPEGATPKDGPSAGITLATAILSAFTNKPVSSKIAMTGEITLRGNVLPIGGLKEKSLAAYKRGIRKIIIPFGNKKDLQELPPEIKDKIKFIMVTAADEAFKQAIKGN